MKLGTYLTRNPDLVAANLDGDTVMLHIESGNYFSLNAVGSKVWEVLEIPATFQNVVAAVSDAFDITKANTLEVEITEFLSELLQNNLIHEVAS